jgi:hypothetical protein
MSAVPEFGKVLYSGSETSFINTNLKADSYIAYYLSGYDKAGKLVTEQVTITAKTKRMGSEQVSFNYILDKSNITVNGHIINIIEWQLERLSNKEKLKN